MSESERIPEHSIRKKRWLANALLICALLSMVFSFLLVPLADSSSRLNARQIFDSSRWHALQLQLQTYRLMNYLSDVEATDLPLRGQAYFQYDLVLSRVDLLRKGEMGQHIRSFSNGRAIRLLNIISGELELISLNIEHLENGQINQIAQIMERLRSLDSQMTDFVVIINQSANEYVIETREKLDTHLKVMQFISIMLLIFSAVLLFSTYKLGSELKVALARNLRLDQRLQDIRFGKVEVISRISSELRPVLSSIVSQCNSVLKESEKVDLEQMLTDFKNNSCQLLTQLDCYQDLTLVEADQLTPNIYEDSIRKRMELSITALQPIFEKHNVRSALQIDNRLPDTVDADFRRIHEVVVALIYHVAPYCNDGDMLINVRPSTLPMVSMPEKHSDKAMKMVQISLRDNGQGLPEHIQEGLRTNPHNPSKYVIESIKKMGIGMTFCHYLISALGGEMHFSSSMDKGTEIWIDLPMGVDLLPPLSHSPKTREHLAVGVVTTDTLLDQAWSNLLTQRNVVHKLISFDQIEDLLNTDNPVPVTSLVISDAAPLSQPEVEMIEVLQESGIHIITTAAILETYPTIRQDSVYHYPLTLNQIQSLKLS